MDIKNIALMYVNTRWEYNACGISNKNTNRMTILEELLHQMLT